MKQTPVKGSSYLGWRVGDDVSHHMEQTIEEGDRAMWEEEEEEIFSSSDAPLDRVPPDPPLWIEHLADAVEEQRLQQFGVLEKMVELKDGYKNLTIRSVRDWRAKPKPGGKDGEKQWLRRSRMVAREHAGSA